MMKIKLTRLMSRQEVEVALACGAEDEKDFYFTFLASEGDIIDFTEEESYIGWGEAGWQARHILNHLDTDPDYPGCWLFEEVEDIE